MQDTVLETPSSKRHPSAQTHFKYPFPIKENLWVFFFFLKKWLILLLGQEMYKMNLDHLVRPGRKCLKNDGGVLKGHRSQHEDLPMAKI